MYCTKIQVGQLGWTARARLNSKSSASHRWDLRLFKAMWERSTVHLGFLVRCKVGSGKIQPVGWAPWTSFPPRQRHDLAGDSDTTPPPTQSTIVIVQCTVFVRSYWPKSTYTAVTGPCIYNLDVRKICMLVMYIRVSNVLSVMLFGCCLSVKVTYFQLDPTSLRSL